MTPDGPVVVVPGQAIEAYALPGAPGRIVVSGRLLDALDDRGRAALLAHEQAHLAARHHLFTTVAHLAAAANPLLLPVARAVDYTVERWADERAAAVTGDRRLVAATIGRVALLTPAKPRRTRAAALAITGTARARSATRDHGRRISLAWAGPVPRRVAALLAPPPGRQLALLAVTALFVLIAGVSAAEAARDLHALIEFAQSVQ
jgi:beta-lactamase regulating signal transducer with metallopeptidase domain